MDATAIGVAEEEDDEQGVDEEHIFHRVVFFLAAINLLYAPLTIPVVYAISMTSNEHLAWRGHSKEAKR